MTETSKPNYLPWIAVAGLLVYLVWIRNPQAPTPGPGPEPKPTPSQLAEVTKSVLPTLKQSFRDVFNDAAAKVESGELKSDQELFDFVQPATRTAREAASKPFDSQLDLSLPRNDDGTFTGHEKEAADLLRKIAKSW